MDVSSMGERKKFYFANLIFLFAMSLTLSGCNEEDGPKKNEADVILSDPIEVKTFMGHISGSDEEIVQKRKTFFTKARSTKVNYTGKIRSIDDLTDVEVEFEGGGIVCQVPESFKHHALKMSKGQEFHCTGTYNSFTSLGGRVTVSVTYQPTEKMIEFFDTPPKIDTFTDIDALDEIHKMDTMTDMEREPYWEAQLNGKIVYATGIVQDVTRSASIFLNAMVVFRNDRILCSISEKDEYLIKKLQKGQSFVCAGKLSSSLFKYKIDYMPNAAPKDRQ
jgi:hypothetical protein